jgi:hypothetical protein
MAWNIRGRQTEHARAKHGNGAYWGPKAIAKHASNKERRVNARHAVASALGDVELTDNTADGVGRMFHYGLAAAVWCCVRHINLLTTAAERRLSVSPSPRSWGDKRTRQEGVEPPTHGLEGRSEAFRKSSSHNVSADNAGT